ncbi:thermosome subunit alpha [Halococcus sp. AFM35]|uniref:thermosome subunit alpha n=1 Tax=Halococcus sp. AFM35 TaxID=3421653 RepID=UPI003EB777F3
MSRSIRQQWITHDLKRTTGDAARQANIDAGRAVATALRSTLGPSGRDKMLVGTNGTVIVTNDGASILDRMDIEDPAAQMVAQAANEQKEIIGDGATTTVLLVGELLSKAEDLLNDGLHPTVILKGYYRAASHTLQRLDKYRADCTLEDNELLQAVAKTAVTGRWGAEATNLFSTLTTDAVHAAGRNSKPGTSSITTKAFPGGELRDSELIDGILVDMDASSTTIEMLETSTPSTLTNARLALVDAEIDIGPPDNIDQVTISTPEQLDSLQEYESDTKNKITQTLANLDVDILFCQKSIDDAIRTRLAKEGILAAERTRQDEFDALARATAATAVQSISDLDRTNIGIAGLVEQRSAGSAHLLIIAGLSGDKQVSLLLRGGTKHVAEETKRIIESCTAVVQGTVQGGGILPGGGATETALSMDLSKYANTISGREQLAIRAFSSSLESIPRALINNAGRDPSELLPRLRNRHVDNPMVGVDSSTGKLRDMLEADILEPTVVKRHCLTTALETAATILRIDDILQHTGTDSGDVTTSDSRRSQGHTSQSTSGYPWAIGH